MLPSYLAYAPFLSSPCLACPDCQFSINSRKPSSGIVNRSDFICIAAAVGEGFLAVSITFRNTAGAIKHQAVAVRNGADLSTFYSSSFEGYQDTLYTHSMRQFYRDRDSYGTIDYILGNAAVVFQNCNIYSRLPMDNQFNTITAQGQMDPNQNTGTSIQNCRIKAAPVLPSRNGMTKSYLGRPWEEYSRPIFMQSYIGGPINPAGWAEWAGTYAPSILYYAEFYNTGPGSNTTNRVTQAYAQYGFQPAFWNKLWPQ